MVSVTMKELLEAGVHFGHQTKRWNPKMKDYIFGQRNGIYIIDLQKTIRVFKDALLFIKSVAESGKEVLMVGTKKQAQDIIRDLSLKCESSYVNQRWLGGLLTNFSVIRGSVEKLIELDEMKEDGRWGLFSKKEQSKQEKVYRKLSKNLGGIKNMLELPGALFVIDSTKEEIAIYEARKLNIPIVAVVDTNGDPENIDHPIPGNDDAVRAIELFTSKVSEAIVEGKKERMDRELLEAKKEEEVSPEEGGTAPEEVTTPEEEVTTPEEEGVAQEEEVATPVEEEVPREEKVVPPEEGQATPSEEQAPSPSKPSDKEKEEGGYTEPEKST